MNPIAFSFFVIVGAMAVAFAFKLFMDKWVTSEPRRPPPPTTRTTPYRSSTPPTGDAKVEDKPKPEDASLPSITVDWQGKNVDLDFQVVCPACRTPWSMKARPRLCACAQCAEPHFHLMCGTTDRANLGCGFNWIMRSALAKKPLVTPPPTNKPIEPKVDEIRKDEVKPS